MGSYEPAVGSSGSQGGNSDNQTFVLRCWWPGASAQAGVISGQSPRPRCGSWVPPDPQAGAPHWGGVSAAPRPPCAPGCPGPHIPRRRDRSKRTAVGVLKCACRAILKVVPSASVTHQRTRTGASTHPAPWKYWPVDVVKCGLYTSLVNSDVVVDACAVSDSEITRWTVRLLA